MKIRISACALFFASSVLLALPPTYEDHSDYRDGDVSCFSDSLKTPRAWKPINLIAEPTHFPDTA